MMMYLVKHFHFFPSQCYMKTTSECNKCSNTGHARLVESRFNVNKGYAERRPAAAGGRRPTARYIRRQADTGRTGRQRTGPDADRTHSHVEWQRKITLQILI